jgi:hypothetical protein
VSSHRTSCLQKVSSKADETSKGGTGEGHGLVGAGSSDGGWGGRCGGLGGCGSDRGLGGNWGGGNNSWGGSVGIDWGGGWGNYARGGNWLDNCAWAVGDGQGGGLSGSVGLAVEGQLSGSWADSGIGSVHISGVDNGAVGVSSGGRGHKGSEGDDGELHLEFGCWY